jgi:hypothetical protein
MFSEVPGGTIKRALGSTTTTGATWGAIVGLSPDHDRRQILAAVVYDRVNEHPRVDHLAEPRRPAGPLRAT